jgi:hypothetical protein
MGDYQANVALANSNTIVQVNNLERQTPTDRLEQVLNRLIADQRREQQEAQVVEAESTDA